MREQSIDIKSHIGDAVLPAEVPSFRSGLRLLQHRDDLFFAETFRFHCPLHWADSTPYPVLFAGVTSVDEKVRDTPIAVAPRPIEPLERLLGIVA